MSDTAKTATLDTKTLGVLTARSLAKEGETIALPRTAVLALVALDPVLKETVDKSLDTFTILNEVPRKPRKPRSDKGEVKTDKGGKTDKK